MSQIKILTLFICMVGLTACVETTKRADLRTVAKPGEAYIYGRFHLDVKANILTLGTCPSAITINMKHLETGEVYKIDLKSREPVYAIKVKPGLYKFDTVHYYLGSGELTNSQSPSRELEFMVAPDTAVYVGDYMGWVSCKSGPGSSGNPQMNFEWGIYDIKFNSETYQNTTNELASKFPDFVHSIRLIPMVR